VAVLASLSFLVDCTPFFAFYLVLEGAWAAMALPVYSLMGDLADLATDFWLRVASSLFFLSRFPFEFTLPFGVWCTLSGLT
jgi:hypothetical protein